jgi:hypothetical protein
VLAWSTTGRGYSGTFVKTGTAAQGCAAIALPPFITGPVARTVLGAFTATELQFGQGFFVGFFPASTMGTLAETAWTFTIY